MPSRCPPAGLKLDGTAILAGIAGSLVGAIAARLLSLSAVLAGGASGIAMALLVVLVFIVERRRAA